VRRIGNRVRDRNLLLVKLMKTIFGNHFLVEFQSIWGTIPVRFFRFTKAYRFLSLGYEVEDFGQLNEDDKTSYCDIALDVARAIQKGVYEKGVICRGTGAGVSIVANKFKGVWAVACESVFTGERCAMINNVNIITLGSRVVGVINGCRIVESWLSKKFLEGLNDNIQEVVLTGFNKLKEIEDRNFQG
jgi:ribose 5-phosphate isomerase B